MITHQDITFRRFQPVAGINYRKQLVVHLDNCVGRYIGAKAWQKHERAAGRIGYLNPQLKARALHVVYDLIGLISADIHRAKALGSNDFTEEQGKAFDALFLIENA
jgi:hypothetical protein